MHKFKRKNFQVSELWEQVMQLPLDHLFKVSFRKVPLAERLLIKCECYQKPRKREVPCLCTDASGSLAEMKRCWDKTVEKRTNSDRQTLLLLCRSPQNFFWGGRHEAPIAPSQLLTPQQGYSWLCSGNLKSNAQLEQFTDALITTYSC